jgi:hypothetical protein
MDYPSCQLHGDAQPLRPESVPWSPQSAATGVRLYASASMPAALLVCFNGSFPEPAVQRVRHYTAMDYRYCVGERRHSG